MQHWVNKNYKFKKKVDVHKGKWIARQIISPRFFFTGTCTSNYAMTSRIIARDVNVTSRERFHFCGNQIILPIIYKIALSGNNLLWKKIASQFCDAKSKLISNSVQLHSNFIFIAEMCNRWYIIWNVQHWLTTTCSIKIYNDFRTVHTINYSFYLALNSKFRLTRSLAGSRESTQSHLWNNCNVALIGYFVPYVQLSSRSMCLLSASANRSILRWRVWKHSKFASQVSATNF
jgi:hypothetical protein